VDGDDVGVLKPGEGRGFSSDVGRHLEGHGAVGEAALAGKEHPPEGAAAQLADQPEAEEVAPGGGHVNKAIGQVAGGEAVRQVQLAEKAEGLVGAGGRVPVVEVDRRLLLGGQAEGAVGAGRLLHRDAGRLAGLGAPAGPAVGADAVVEGVFARRGGLPRPVAEAVLLEGDLAQAFGVGEEVGKVAAVVVQRPGLAGLPAPFQVDSDQFAEHRAIQRVLRRGQVGPQVGGALVAGALERLDVVIQGVRRRLHGTSSRVGRGREKVRPID
jgi:hypothetical protein